MNGTDDEKPSESYGQILKASSIIGGAQGINYLLSLARTKLVAVLLGPSGVGLVGLYVSLTGLIGTVSGLGIETSGVREVAGAHASGNSERVAHTVKTLRRVCWLAGLLGWLLTVGLSYPLSLWAFGSADRVWSIAFLGGTVLLGALSGGQLALIQGTMRIGDLARLNVIGAAAATIVSVGMYAWLGENGIVPVLVTTAIINLGFTGWFAAKIETPNVTQSWTQTLENSKRLIGLGLAFMYGALLAALLGLIIRTLIVRQLGLEANGIYQAAWALSGLFAGFILGAMGTDFYPRLTAVADDNTQVNRLVSEQAEIGILLALPGLLCTLTFAPWIMDVFYSEEFSPAAELLPWFTIGVFGQLMTFPLGFIQRAKGRVGWIVVSQSHLNVLNLLLALVLIREFGVVGAAWAFATTTYVHGIVVFAIARHLSEFRTRQSTRVLALFATGFIVLAFSIQHLWGGVFAITLGSFVAFVGSLFSLRGISSRLGPDHRIVKFVLKIPGGRLASGL